MPSNILTVGHFTPSTTALGPGNRAAIWLQGCGKTCKGCASPEFLSKIGGKDVEAGEFAATIANFPDIQGVTISGGEPLDQAGALQTFLIALQHQRPNWTIIVFTGYTVQQVVDDPDMNKLVSSGLIDVLIDGPFIEALNENIGLRGSSNQRVIYLSERLKSSQLETQSRILQFEVNAGIASLIGIPLKGLLEKLSMEVINE